jgi:formiminotetrahydrofolate cyclodeaminase/predicted GIY-YIG superfamily endonuclease
MEPPPTPAPRAGSVPAAAAYVYLVRCADGSYYTGWTTDLARRVATHNRGAGARYTRSRRPVTLAYYEALPDAGAARRREARLRRLSHAAKHALAQAHLFATQQEECPMAQLVDLTVLAFLDELASASPTPGGGSASALAAAMGAAMVSMACNLTIGREKFKDVEAELQDVLAQAERLRQELTAAVDEDTAAYSAVSAAYKLPKTTDEEKAARTAAIQAALRGATDVPLKVARAAATLLPLTEIAQRKANPNVASDARVAEMLARAGRDGAIANVEINLGSLHDSDYALRIRAELDLLVAGSAVGGQ